EEHTAASAWRTVSAARTAHRSKRADGQDAAAAHRLLSRRDMDDDQVLHELYEAIVRLADTVADEPPLASALQRFADGLPATRPALRRAVAARVPRNP